MPALLSGKSTCSSDSQQHPSVGRVQLPESLSALSYANILCGVVRGALEMVGVALLGRLGRTLMCWPCAGAIQSVVPLCK